MSTKIQGTLESHIVRVVQSLEADGVTFSAFDITKRLRKRINDGEAEILGRAYKTIPQPNGGTVYAQWVDHTEVRDLVHSLFDQNYFPNLTRNNNGQFWEYSPIGAVSAPVSVPVPGGLPVGNSVLVAPVQSASPGPSAAAPTIGGLSTGSGNLVCSGFIGQPPVPSPSPASLPVNPPKSPLERLTENSKPILRLRLKLNQKYIVLPGGKTAWKRRCDLTQNLTSKDRNHVVRDAIQSGEVEVVEV